jgi:iron-sulfur cluster repair protein YtfE (RIC family)
MIRFQATTFSVLVAGLVAGLLLRATYSHAQSDTHAHPSSASEHSSLGIPKAMQAEHEALHSELAQLTNAGGRTGEAAQAVAHVLDHHFQKENEYALPPLGLLVPLSEGKFDCGMTAVLPMTEQLQADMSTMLAEHKDIAAALSQLKNAATSENKPEGVKFADELAAHAQNEEQITYPTALLIGLYVKGKSAQCSR